MCLPPPLLLSSSMQVSPTQENLLGTINELDNVLSQATVVDRSADNAQIIADLFEKVENLAVNEMVNSNSFHLSVMVTMIST